MLVIKFNNWFLKVSSSLSAKVSAICSIEGIGIGEGLGIDIGINIDRNVGISAALMSISQQPVLLYYCGSKSRVIVLWFWHILITLN